MKFYPNLWLCPFKVWNACSWDLGATKLCCLSTPRHLIPPLVFPGVCVSLVFTVLWIVPFTWSEHWFWLQNSSVYLIGRTDFDSEFFPLPNLDTLIMTHGLKKGSRRVRPVSRGCLLLLGTWSYLWYFRGFVLAHLFIWLVIPTWISKLITLWYLGHFRVVLSNISKLYNTILL
jgi:hypothetical protein